MLGMLFQTIRFRHENAKSKKMQQMKYKEKKALIAEVKSKTPDDEKTTEIFVKSTEW